MRFHLKCTRIFASRVSTTKLPSAGERLSEIVDKHAGKLLIEIGPTFFVTIYLCEFFCYWRQIFYMNRYVHGKGNYHFGFLVFVIFGGKVTPRMLGEN